ncbi:metal ABC transporter solute-binding protein, Zn/Mn family [Microbacterium rhizomatis]|uniref:Metal ABC transporter substrate-binding protein n=1 Tax=Microbacterium rhizomatis TaxID=1631477 RepID=A0A5J5J4M2_9MICO|nr:zinc ABC transporter substrate-binding protein [Microbacterium rhizomatis]KAA9108420.1 metal ABC transporter substrate-binding protein [Microbacterium rhizomatis]
MARKATVLAALGAFATLLAGCSGTASPAGSTAGTLSVVASTNVYGQIAEAVGGDAVTVTSLIASSAQDPHEFEPSAGDQLKVQRADLLIENGGGYDPFLDALVGASGTTAPVITAAQLSPEWPADDDTSTHTDDADHAHDHLEGFNEHVFYDPATMGLLAEAIAQQLGSLDPARAAEFTQNAKTFADGTAALEDSLATIARTHAGARVFVTEPLPLYLTDAAGLENATPSAFSEAVEGGQDVPPATLLDALRVLSSGEVKVVITNAQAAGAETTQVEDAAGAAGIPVLKFSEILPDGTTYLGWMQGNIDQLAKALGA